MSPWSWCTSLPTCVSLRVSVRGAERSHQGVGCLPPCAFTIHVIPSKAMWKQREAGLQRSPYSKQSPHPTHINPLSYLAQVWWLTLWWQRLSNVSHIGLFTCRLNYSSRIHVHAIYGQQALWHVGPAAWKQYWSQLAKFTLLRCLFCRLKRLFFILFIHSCIH